MRLNFAALIALGLGIIFVWLGFSGNGPAAWTALAQSWPGVVSTSSTRAASGSASGRSTSTTGGH